MWQKMFAKRELKHGSTLRQKARGKMSEELKPCPFCGENVWTIYAGCGEDHSVVCENCEAESPIAKSAEDAVKEWNTRPAEDALKAEVERLRAELEELAGYVHRFRETLADVAKMAIDVEQEQIFEKCRDALQDVYLEEVFRDKFDKILHNSDTEKGGEDE